MALVVSDYQRHFYLEGGGDMDINERMYRALEWPDMPKRREPVKAKHEPGCDEEKIV